MAGTRYYMTLHNLMQAGDIEFTADCVESGRLHQASWGCYIHIRRINNLTYRNVAPLPFTFIGTGSNRAEAKDDAARNALGGLGFSMANVQ